MRTLVIGDIHGGLKALTQLIEIAKVTKDDRLIFVGDYVDGWSESAQVIQYLIELSKTNDCVFIKGNHDVWCADWLRTGDGDSVWLAHGGKETVDSYDGFSEADKKQHLYFFEDMQLYHIDNDNRLFLHAGFTSGYGVEREIHKENFYFDRTLWEMALTMDKHIDKQSELYPNRLKHYHEIYIGHTPTTNFKQSQPMKAINVWNVDTGAAFKGKLSAMDLETKEMFQSDTVYTLYPNELGRNK
jgi:serine/threonine protein phosphatase 1